jgi:hypothetical protein
MPSDVVHCVQMFLSNRTEVHSTRRRQPARAKIARKTTDLTYAGFSDWFLPVIICCEPYLSFPRISVNSSLNCGILPRYGKVRWFPLLDIMARANVSVSLRFRNLSTCSCRSAIFSLTFFRATSSSPFRSDRTTKAAW